MGRRPAGRGAASCGWVALALATIVATLLHVFAFDLDITGFFRIGAHRPLPPSLAAPRPVVFVGEAGYDGQQFLALAMDPLLRDSLTLQCFDNPRYRCRRILYPALGWVLALGDPRRIPFALVGMNLAAIGLLVFVIGLYLVRAGRPAPWSLLALAPLGVWVVLSLSTAELLCGLLLVSGLHAYQLRRPALAAAALGLAVLAREVALIPLAMVTFAAVLEGRRRDAAVIAAGAIPGALWNLWVVSRVPASAAPTGEAQDFGAPLAGLVWKFGAIARGGPSLKGVIELGSFVLLAAVLVLLLVSAWRRRDEQVLGWVGIGYALLFLFGGRAILGYYVDYNRIFLDVYLLAALSTATGRFERTRLALFILSGIMSAGYCAAYIFGKI